MGDEVSRALPSRMYADPAKVVEALEQEQLGCRLCVKSAFTFIRVFCAEARNVHQQGVPSIGYRCKWFDERVPGDLLGVKR